MGRKGNRRRAESSGVVLAGVGAFLLLVLLAAPPPARGRSSPALPPPAPPPALEAPRLPPLAFPKGAVVPHVDCPGAPGQSYALYLPSGYTPDRPWPVLYAFDARGDGAYVADLFRAGAERYGYVIASSNTSASDRPDDPNPAALSAMWRDTHARFAVDDRRIYLAGMSGTVRAAVALAHDAPGVVAGVIGAAAGWPFERSPGPGDKFLFYGTTAFGDYNYFEVLGVEKDLERLRLPHHVELFDGVHQWMPAEIATRALAWLDLQAMKAGSRAKEADWIEAQWNETLARARGYEASGSLFLAEREYRAAAADFAGLREAASAAAKAAEIRSLPAFQRDAKERARIEKRDKAYLERARSILALVNPENGPATAAQIAGALQVAELRTKAKEHADPEERWSASRLLATLWGQTNSFLPSSFVARKEYDRAILCYSIAMEIHTEFPHVWVNRAAAYARKGDRKRALADLAHAAEMGWNDVARLEKAESFSTLREDEEFQKLLARMRQSTGGPTG